MTQASEAATKYCARLVDQGVVLSRSQGASPASVVAGAAEKGNDLALSVVFDVSACPADKSISTLDFSKLGQQDCEKDLFGAISQFCQQDSTWGDYDPDYTLEGGVFAIDCGLWGMVGQAS